MNSKGAHQTVAGWSAPLLSPCSQIRFSREEAHNNGVNLGVGWGGGRQRRRDFGNRETKKTSFLMNEPKEDP